MCSASRIQNELKPLIVIAGPTAVGKSQISIELATALKGEIITADSMQVYRGIDIATDKPTKSEMQGIPHHMIDVVNPDEPFNVVTYRDMALDVIDDVIGRGRLPILAGGTGLYMRAVLDDWAFPDAKSDPSIRHVLKTALETTGKSYLHDRLQSVDPVTAQRLHPNDTRRVIRALEVYISTGKPLSEHIRTAPPPPQRFQTAMVALDRPREQLYERINRRVDQQIKRGLLDEVAYLLSTYDKLPMAGQSIGIKEMIPVVQGDMGLDEATTILKRNTRRYAKRQWTWFRRDERFEWFDVSTYKDAVEAATDIAAFSTERLRP